MSNTGIFSSTAGVHVTGSTAPENKPRAVITLTGERQPLNIPAIELSRSSQASRLQVEATPDGSMYATGCATGIGQYTMTFIDGTADVCEKAGNDTSNNSILAKYLSKNTLADRKVDIRLYRGSTKQVEASVSSKPLATFTGILHNMTTDFRESSGGAIVLLVTLSVAGSWKS